MMSDNPVVVNLPADQWTKVVSDITTGTIDKKSIKPNVYRATFRIAGDPPGDLDADAVTIFIRVPYVIVSNDDQIDVYIKPVRSDGQIVVNK